MEKGIQPTDPYSGLNRKNLYKQYRTERNYQIDSKAERALNRQVVNIRSAYLKEHGVVLTELELSTDKIKKAYAGHEHKWKFHQNLNQLKDTILQTGELPANYQERLERKATSHEIQVKAIKPAGKNRSESLQMSIEGLQVRQTAKLKKPVKS